MRAFNKCGPQLVFSHSTQRWHQLPSDKLGNRQRVLTRMRVTSVELRSREVTRENFAQFGQVWRHFIHCNMNLKCAPKLVMWQEDGVLYSEEKEARLDIASGQPRLYIMRLRNNSDKEINFTEMNFHANSTQTLGSLKDDYWWEATSTFILWDFTIFQVSSGSFSYILRRGFSTAWLYSSFSYSRYRTRSTFRF